MMKISMDSISLNPLDQAREAGRDASARQISTAGGGDVVTVSHDARLLAEANRAAQDAPDVRADKVEALRIQVRNGTYRPDSRLIASALVDEEPALFML
ncbi:MAG: flagellar biosynthesis anti-sigma factor FlgM [Desulfovibrio sp.]|nr:flagellar biosynthesis anti-sigma factor FlgM [Desulfovibrio sp.]